LDGSGTLQAALLAVLIGGKRPEWGVRLFLALQARV
jgi:hypothetical protein